MITIGGSLSHFWRVMFFCGTDVSAAFVAWQKISVQHGQLPIVISSYVDTYEVSVVVE